MHLSNIEDTRLWQQLDRGFEGTDQVLAKDLAQRLKHLCAEAEARMKWVPAFLPQYTLHDDVHLLRVTELMAMITPDEVRNGLNPVEIYLMILAAFFHDQGMVLDDETQNLENLPGLKTFRDNWYIDHPNHRELRELQRSSHFNEAERDRFRKLESELDAAMLTEYVRRGHGPRSAAYVRQRHSNDARWNVAGVNISHHVAALCVSHTESSSELTDANGFRVDESISTYQVNMRYLAVLLRLADILDFDRDRTPDSLYRTIHFSSPVSLEEWEKHRSVQGWTITQDIIRFTIRCEHPIYQRSALRFMDWIDEELSKAHDIVRSFPPELSTRYRLDLPALVDRSRIEPLDQSYKYHDLEFSLSRDEIVKLLMTDQLYGSPSLTVRELLQNSLDALRYRRALIRRDSGADWPTGKVTLEHFVDSGGYEVLHCTDNGVGMDETIIQSFLTRVGRSYYRSPEFQRERETFVDAGVDFDPCAQFGIGFMSIFMVGERVLIRTRRDYGRAGYGDPLEIEINGLNGLLVVRPGNDQQAVGTKVEITGRKKPRHFDQYRDEIRLVPMLRGYVLASEFPVSGVCTIPEIAGSIDIPTQAAVPTTAIEQAGISSIVTVSQSFSEVDSRLGGSMRSSFIIDDEGNLTIANNDAKWDVQQRLGDERWPTLVLANGNKLEEGRVESGQVSIDGILVAGEPGRDGKNEPLLGSWASPIHVGKENFVLDVRGELKPEITPARTPVRGHGFFNPPRWRRLEMLVEKTRGKLWQQVLPLPASNGAETIWALMLIYQVNPAWMDSDILWQELSVPLLTSTGEMEWRHISELGSVRVGRAEEQTRWLTPDNAEVRAPDSLRHWNNQKYGYVADAYLRSVIADLSVAELVQGECVYRVAAPELPDRSPSDLHIRGNMFESSVTLQKYGPGLTDYLAARLPIRSVNGRHPLAKLALEGQDLAHLSGLHEFAQALARAVSDPSFLNELTKENGRHRRMLHVGGTYKDVDWEQISDELLPPYSVLVGETEAMEITADHLACWAELSWRDLEATTPD